MIKVVTMPGKYVHLKFLKENTQDNPGLIAELIEIFLQTTPLMLDELDRYYKHNEWVLLRKTAHKLKSNLFTLGIEELSQPILRVEQFNPETDNVAETGLLIKKIRNVSESAFEELELELVLLKEIK